MCQKNNKDDVFHFCNCFDKAGNPLTGTDVENTAYYACCNCPGERRDQYSIFEDLTINNQSFSLGNIRNVSLNGCPKIKIEQALQVEQLFISDTSQVTILDGAKMANLNLLSVKGRSRRTDLIFEANTQNWASKITSLSLSNVKLVSLPKAIVLKSLFLVDSFVGSDIQDFGNLEPGIEEIKVLSSEIENVRSLNVLSSMVINKEMTFENNTILSSCSSCENDEATCFIDSINTFQNNSFPCSCQDGCECNKAITRFSCDEDIANQTFCSDVSDKSGTRN